MSLAVRCIALGKFSPAAQRFFRGRLAGDRAKYLQLERSSALMLGLA